MIAPGRQKRRTSSLRHRTVRQEKRKRHTGQEGDIITPVDKWHDGLLEYPQKSKNKLLPISKYIQTFKDLEFNASI